MPEWITDPRTILVIVTAIGGVGYGIGQVNAHKKYFEEFRNEVKNEFSNIRDSLQKIFERLGPPTAASSSPAQLTDFGERVAKRINALEWAASTAKTILKDQDLLRLQPYQIESFCQDFVNRESTSGGSLEDKVLLAIYEFGIDRDRAFPVLSIPLREELLKRQAELRAIHP